MNTLDEVSSQPGDVFKNMAKIWDQAPNAHLHLNRKEQTSLTPNLTYSTPPIYMGEVLEVELGSELSPRKL